MINRLIKIRNFILGEPRNPLNPETRKNIALIAFLAWVGLGADGLSSSCYGPEEAFLALGGHTHLGLYLAFATAITVFVISLAYNQIIELFPSGGGGYKVATRLIGPYAGLISGSALIIDYILTIVTSIASAADAFFSLLPAGAQFYKLFTEVILVFLLIILNLRGMKESIKVLLPIFLGFMITHVALIIYGITAHRGGLPQLIPQALSDTKGLAAEMGWPFVVALTLRAYSVGSGTYTGIEAVSNNVNTLAEPRVSTGKWTMFYMALSLSFTAAGIILLYLLWQVGYVKGETLNAVTFRAILGDSTLGHISLIIVLLLEAGLLFVAANTGFLGGPAVLANMAVDSWVPNRFRYLSSRLVTQNGVILFGLGALALLLWSRGHVSLLVVLYSINVFITFSMSLFGLCIYWVRHRHSEKHWMRRLCLSGLGLLVTSSILLVTLSSKFKSGGWVTVLITSAVVGVCLLIRRHYKFLRAKLLVIDKEFSKLPMNSHHSSFPELQPLQPTAVFFVGKSRGSAMHTLLSVQRMFSDHFKNFVFVSVGEVDVQSFGGKSSLEKMQHEVNETLQYFVKFCHHHGLAATSYCNYGTDPVEQLDMLADQVHNDFPNSIFFASKLVFDSDNWITRLLHFETVNTMQRRLHLKGMQLVILPMKIAVT